MNKIQGTVQGLGCTKHNSNVEQPLVVSGYHTGWYWQHVCPAGRSHGQPSPAMLTASVWYTRQADCAGPRVHFLIQLQTRSCVLSLEGKGAGKDKKGELICRITPGGRRVKTSTQSFQYWEIRMNKEHQNTAQIEGLCPSWEQQGKTLTTWSEHKQQPSISRNWVLFRKYKNQVIQTSSSWWKGRKTCIIWMWVL